MFEYKGAKFSLKDVQAAADEAGLSLEEYISKHEITKVEEDVVEKKEFIYEQSPERKTYEDTKGVMFNKGYNRSPLLNNLKELGIGGVLDENEIGDVTMKADKEFDAILDGSLEETYSKDVLDKELDVQDLNKKLAKSGNYSGSSYLFNKLFGELISGGLSKIKQEVFQLKPEILESGIMPEALKPYIEEMGTRDDKELMSDEEQYQFDTISRLREDAAKEILSFNGEQPTDVEVQEYISANRGNSNLIQKTRDLYANNAVEEAQKKSIQEFENEALDTETAISDIPVEERGDIRQAIDKLMLKSGLVTSEEKRERDKNYSKAIDESEKRNYC